MSNNDFLTKEELQKGFEQAYPDTPEEQITTMVDDWISEAHGTEDNYRTKLEAFRAEQEEAADNGVDEDSYRDISWVYNNMIATSGLKEEFTKEADSLKNQYIEKGLTVLDARQRAYKDIVNKHGEDALQDTDTQIDSLVTAGYDELDRYRGRIKVQMAANGGNVIEAYRKVVSEDHKAAKQFDKMSKTEKEFYTFLDNEDRAAVAGLKAAMPDEQWSYEKYYRSRYGNKPRKVTPKKPKEETVTQEEYDREHQRVLAIEKKLFEMGINANII